MKTSELIPFWSLIIIMHIWFATGHSFVATIFAVLALVIYFSTTNPDK